MIAHDTRPSASVLMAAAVAGVTALGGMPVQCGLLSTPQLHWMVRRCYPAVHALRSGNRRQ